MSTFRSFLSILNPFHQVVETKNKDYLFARVFRTTFKEKVWDAFEVFWGNLDIDFNTKKPYKKTHFGIFDYLTAGLLFIIPSFLLNLHKKNWVMPTLLSGSLAFIGAVLCIPRLIFASVMLLLSLPFIGFVHIWGNKKGAVIRKEIAEYEIKTKHSYEFLNTNLKAKWAPVAGKDITFKFKDSVETISFSLNETADKAFFINCRKLNLCGIQTAIEKEAPKYRIMANINNYG